MNPSSSSATQTTSLSMVQPEISQFVWKTDDEVRNACEARLDQRSLCFTEEFELNRELGGHRPKYKIEKYKDGEDVDEIMPNLYLGGDSEVYREFSTKARNQYSVIINSCDRTTNIVRYYKSLLNCQVIHIEHNYVVIHMNEGTKSAVQAVYEWYLDQNGRAIIKNALTKGEKVLLSGDRQNPGIILAALYLMDEFNISAIQACHYVRACRPNLELTNEYIRALVEYEQQKAKQPGATPVAAVPPNVSDTWLATQTKPIYFLRSDGTLLINNKEKYSYGDRSLFNILSVLTALGVPYKLPRYYDNKHAYDIRITIEDTPQNRQKLQYQRALSTQAEINSFQWKTEHDISTMARLYNVGRPDIFDEFLPNLYIGNQNAVLYNVSRDHKSAELRRSDASLADLSATAEEILDEDEGPLELKMVATRQPSTNPAQDSRDVPKKPYDSLVEHNLIVDLASQIPTELQGVTTGPDCTIIRQILNNSAATPAHSSTGDSSDDDTDDHAEKNHDNFHALLNWYLREGKVLIHQALAEKKKVLFACEDGISKSSVLAILYIMDNYNTSALQAYHYLRSYRQIAEPAPSYAADLLEYDKQRQRDNPGAVQATTPEVSAAWLAEWKAHGPTNVSARGDDRNQPAPTYVMRPGRVLAINGVDSYDNHTGGLFKAISALAAMGISYTFYRPTKRAHTVQICIEDNLHNWQILRYQKVRSRKDATLYTPTYLTPTTTPTPTLTPPDPTPTPITTTTTSTTILGTTTTVTSSNPPSPAEHPINPSEPHIEIPAGTNPTSIAPHKRTIIGIVSQAAPFALGVILQATASHELLGALNTMHATMMTGGLLALGVGLFCTLEQQNLRKGITTFIVESGLVAGLSYACFTFAAPMLKEAGLSAIQSDMVLCATITGVAVIVNAMIMLTKSAEVGKSD